MCDKTEIARLNAEIARLNAEIARLSLPIWIYSWDYDTIAVRAKNEPSLGPLWSGAHSGKLTASLTMVSLRDNA